MAKRRDCFSLSMNRKVGCLHCNDLCNSGSWVVSRSERNTELSMNRAGCGSQTRGPDRASVRRSGSWVSVRDSRIVEAFSMNLTLVGTSRCDVPAREAAGRHHCAAERGADGAARRPYQVQGPKRENFVEFFP